MCETPGEDDEDDEAIWAYIIKILKVRKLMGRRDNVDVW